jgi:hypothetical protein
MVPGTFRCPFYYWRGGRCDQAKRNRDVHVHRADAQRGESNVRGLREFFQDVTGQLFVFIVMTVAAAEAAVGLGIIIAIFRNRESLDVDDASILKL